MSTTTKTIEVVVTTCDRPRCGRVVSEAPASKGKKQPALVIQRPGKPDIVYGDLCDFCTNATDNLCDGIEKKEKEKPKKVDDPGEDGAPPVEPVDPPEQKAT